MYSMSYSIDLQITKLDLLLREFEKETVMRSSGEGVGLGGWPLKLFYWELSQYFIQKEMVSHIMVFWGAKLFGEAVIAVPYASIHKMTIITL